MTLDQKFRIWIRESPEAEVTEGTMYGPDDDVRLHLKPGGGAQIEHITGTYTSRMSEADCATVMWSARTPDVYGSEAFEKDIVQAVKTPSVFDEVEQQTLEVLDVGELRFDKEVGAFVVWGQMARWPLIGDGSRTGIQPGVHFKRVGDVFRTPDLLNVNDLPESYSKTWGL